MNIRISKTRLRQKRKVTEYINIIPTKTRQTLAKIKHTFLWKNKRDDNVTSKRVIPYAVTQ